MSMSKENEKVYELHKGLFGETDRNSGEYHFRSGSTEQIYSNAHYAPIGEDPVPPRYYKPSAGTAGRTRRIRGVGFLAVLVLCLACAILGGVVGAGLMSSYFKEDEQSVIQEAVQPFEVSAAAYAPVRNVMDYDRIMSPAEIYDMACEQVVSIRTEYSVQAADGTFLPANVDGTGFVVDDDGYILTNYHVVEKAYQGNYPVDITFFDGSIYDGSIIGVDESNDFAMVRIDREGLKEVTFGDPADIRGGENVYIMGSPYGMLDYTMNSGHISNPSANVLVDDTGNRIDMFQLDVSVYEGNSGGPVYNDKGQVIGIVTARVDVNSSEGIGFAVPVSGIEPFYNELISKGIVAGRPSLGISFFEDYNDTYVAYWNLPSGVFIDAVQPGSCAERAGLRAGDVLAQIADIEIRDLPDVDYALETFNAFDTVDVIFFREGNRMSTTVTFDESVG